MADNKPTIEKIQRITSTYKTLRDILTLAKHESDISYALDICEWIRAEAKTIRSAEALELIRDTYIYGGRHSFDQYMIACEWNRAPQARFWLPRRKVLEGKHKIATQIQDFIDDPETLYLGFSMPPGTGKTTVVKFLLAYIAGKYPDSMNIYVSYSDGLVKMMLDSETAILKDTNEYMHNEIFFNGTPYVSAEYKTISYRKKGDFPTLGLVSIGGSVTGRTRANKFLVTDDLVSGSEMARSPERLENLYNDYTSTLTTRMIGENVKQIQLGTIWSVHDPISRMKSEHEDDPRYRFIAIPVWDEETEESNFEYDHPDRYTTESIRNLKKTLDPVDFSCLYMQRGIEKEGLAFPSDQLKYYYGVLPDGQPDNISFVCDVAWGGGDYLSMPICYDYGGDRYIHDVVFDNRDKFRTKPRVIAKVLQHKIKMGRFEANNGGDEYCDDINRELRQAHKYSMNLSHKKAPSTMSKASRIEQHAPEIRNLYFLAESYRDEDYKKFMNNLTSYSFTTKNKNDDAPDSLAMLIDYMFSGIKTITVGKRFF